jgi:hypothetical protein
VRVFADSGQQRLFVSSPSVRLRLVRAPARTIVSTFFIMSADVHEPCAFSGSEPHSLLDAVRRDLRACGEIHASYNAHHLGRTGRWRLGYQAHRRLRRVTRHRASPSKALPRAELASLKGYLLALQLTVGATRQVQNEAPVTKLSDCMISGCITRAGSVGRRIDLLSVAELRTSPSVKGRAMEPLV